YQDERNFLRDPPSGVDFQFNLEHMMPVALAVLKDDEELERMRFTLVPKRIKEDRFWRNYFYRVSLIKQSTQLSSLSLNKDPRSRSSESLNKSSDKSDSSPTTQQDTSQQIQQHDEPIHTEDVAGSPTTNEFASDAFDDNAHLSEEEMTQMLGGLNDKTEGEGTTTTTSNDNDWELDKELQEELESFELVNDDGTKGESDDDEDNEWQKEIEDLLDEDNENETKKT
uniref:BSD domain-containing protein n=2 Tax=Clytia hemisphaerica TaxID=252671 RepID=A0A7M5XHG9_9CNID